MNHKHLEFGIGMFGDLTYDTETQKFQSPDDRLAQILEQVQFADKLGIDVFAAGEHHRADYAITSPEIILAALASTTQNIRLSSGVSVLSSTDPVKLYKDFATIDLLSHGRAEIMAGRGSFTESFPVFGYQLHDYSALFQEKLDLLFQLNNQETISWKGNFRAPLREQEIFPRPYKHQKMPLWIAVGGSPESVVRAAAYGAPVIFAIIGGKPEYFKPFIELYKKEYLRHGHDPEMMQIGVHVHTYISEQKNQILEEYFPLYAAQMDRVGKSRWWAPYTKAQFLEGMKTDGALFIGNKQEVQNKIETIIDMFGLTRFMAHIDIGGPSHRALMHTIEIYGSEIIPELRKKYWSWKIFIKK